MLELKQQELNLTADKDGFEKRYKIPKIPDSMLETRHNMLGMQGNRFYFRKRGITFSCINPTYREIEQKLIELKSGKQTKEKKEAANLIERMIFGAWFINV